MPDYPKRVKNEEEVTHLNLWVTRRLLAAFSWAQPEAFEKFISPENFSHSPHPEETEREEDEIKVQHQAYPDIHYREELSVAEGDMVFIGWEGTATHLGSLFNHKATGIRVSLSGGEILRFKDGQVIEHFDHYSKPRLESLALLNILDGEAFEKLEQENLL